MMKSMNTQLVLIDERKTDWRLDPKTREIGRKGLEQARAALQEALRRTAA
jgi:hypothetical protein